MKKITIGNKFHGLAVLKMMIYLLRFWGLLALMAFFVSFKAMTMV